MKWASSVIKGMEGMGSYEKRSREGKIRENIRYKKGNTQKERNSTRPERERGRDERETKKKRKRCRSLAEEKGKVAPIRQVGTAQVDIRLFTRVCTQDAPPVGTSG